MIDLGRVAKLLSLHIRQSEDTTNVTIGQGEYMREMIQSLGVESLNSCVTPVEPKITLSFANCLTETSSDVDKELMRGVDY